MATDTEAALPVFTTGVIKRRTGAPLWAIRRAIDQMFPTNPRVGPYRVCLPGQYDELVEALRPYARPAEVAS